MKTEKYHIYLSTKERNEIVASLINLKKTNWLNKADTPTQLMMFCLFHKEYSDAKEEKTFNIVQINDNYYAIIN